MSTKANTSYSFKLHMHTIGMAAITYHSHKNGPCVLEIESIRGRSRNVEGEYE